MLKNATPPTENAHFYVEDGASWASWGPLGASWGRLGGLLGASWGLLGAQDEAKMEPSWAKLGSSWDEAAILEGTWPNMADKMPS